MRILGIDPGETTGWGLLEGSRVLRVGEVKLPRIGEFLRDFEEVDVYVVEDYVQRPDYLMKGKRNNLWIPQHTAKIIGRVQQTAFLQGKPCILQQPSCKPAGYGFAGVKYVKGKKGTHMQDAVAHASFYWMTVGRNLENDSQ